MRKITIRKLREKLGLTQLDLSDLLDATQPTVSAWECGINKPHNHFRKELDAMAKKIGFEIDYDIE